MNDILGGIQFGLQLGERGRQMGQQRALNRLAGQAYSAPNPQARQEAIGQAMGVDADAGMALNRNLQHDDAVRTQRLVIMARALTKAPEQMRPGLYQQMVPELSRLGLQQLPPQYDATVAQTAQQLVEAFGDADHDQIPAAIRELQMLQANPELAALDMRRRTAGFGRPQLFTDANGNVMWLTPPTGAGMPQGTPGPQQAPSQGVTLESMPYVMDPDMAAAPPQVTNALHASEQAAGNAPLPGGQGALPPPLNYTGGGYQGALGVAAVPGVRGQTRSATQDQFVPLTPQETAALGLPSGAVAQRNTSTGKVDVISSPTVRDAGGGKPLNQSTVNQLTKDADKLANLGDLASRFQPSFAGNGFGGSVENLAGRLGGERFGVATPGQAEWWQQYDRYKNEVRNELFGASLTEGEQRAFEAADITPNMDPAVVQQNLAMQQGIIRRALQRRAQTWAAQGYNRDAIEQASGVSVPAQARTAPASPAASPQFTGFRILED